MIANKTLLQMKYARIISLFAERAGIPAAQALDFRRPAHSSPLIEQIHADFRAVVPFLEVDTYMHPLIISAAKFIREKQYL